MQTLKEVIPAVVLVLGIELIVVGMISDSWSYPLRLALVVVGGLCVLFWETTPWLVHSELARVCRRLSMERVDFIYDVQTKRVMVCILTANGEVRSSMEYGVIKEGSEDEVDKIIGKVP